MSEFVIWLRFLSVHGIESGVSDSLEWSSSSVDLIEYVNNILKISYLVTIQRYYAPEIRASFASQPAFEDGIISVAASPFQICDAR
jgi:hypothetical protein